MTRKTTVDDIVRTAETAAFRMALQPGEPVDASRLQPVLDALAGRRFPLEDEKQTQAAIAKVLDDSFDHWSREVRIAGGVIDFVVGFYEPTPPHLRSVRLVSVGIEVKLKGSPRNIARQVKGYAAERDLAGLVLVTAKAMTLPVTIGGKPVAVLDLGRAWL